MVPRKGPQENAKAAAVQADAAFKPDAWFQLLAGRRVLLTTPTHGMLLCS